MPREKVGSRRAYAHLPEQHSPLLSQPLPVPRTRDPGRAGLRYTRRRAAHLWATTRTQTTRREASSPRETCPNASRKGSMLRVVGALSIVLVLPALRPASMQTPAARPLRIIAFGAHPDDAELKASGVAALWAAQGHKVKFVAMTNGDVGHFEQAGGPLARRRTAEVAECARILGIESAVMDVHDGELTPSLENRRAVARLIREWQAGNVMGHRPP